MFDLCDFLAVAKVMPKILKPKQAEGQNTANFDTHPGL